MSQEDERTLEQHKASFKLYKKKYAVSTYLMQMLSLDDERWRLAYAAFQWHKSALLVPNSKEKQIDDLMTDLFGIFLLRSASEALKSCKQDKPQDALKALSACTIGTC